MLPNEEMQGSHVYYLDLLQTYIASAPLRLFLPACRQRSLETAETTRGLLLPLSIIHPGQKKEKKKEQTLDMQC